MSVHSLALTQVSQVLTDHWFQHLRKGILPWT
jgi:hypothetical protein